MYQLKFLVVVPLVAVLVVALSAATQLSVASAHGFTSVHEILEVDEPSLLPGDTLYFLKNWGRGIRLFFTFDAVRKAELELRFLDEKLAEFGRLLEEKADAKDALDGALDNYLKAQERLQAKIESLRGKNKNADKLLEKLAKRVVDHEEIFEKLGEKISEGLEKKLEQAEEAIAKSVEKAILLDERKFKDELKNAIKEAGGALSEQAEEIFEDLGDFDLDDLDDNVGEDLESIEEELKPGADNKKSDINKFCTQEFNPVCGTDRKTYSNACFAEIAGVEIKHKGECKAATAPPPPPPPVPSEVNVEIQDGGFTPQTVKVKREGKVIWLNKSSRSSWPASDVHPTHQIYPGFDAIGGIGPGGIYSFTFDKAGSWNYHDHFSPGMRGMVQVVE